METLDQNITPNEPTAEEKQNAGLIHLLGAFTGIIAPIILWSMHKEKSSFVNAHGKTAVNWHITALIGYLIGAVTSCFFVGYFVMLIVLVLNIVYSVQAYNKAKEGQMYDYPMTIKFIK